jgi:hypothetical protein
MPKAHLTALIAALALGTVAPRVAAQDTSSAGQARPDTSGYTGGGGVDTSASAGQTAGTDSARAAAARATDTVLVGQDAPVKPDQPAPRLREAPPPPKPTEAPGRVDASDTTGPLGATDTSALCGRHADTTKVGDTTPAKPVPCPSSTDTGSSRRSADSAGVPQPTRQPSQSTSGTVVPRDSTR